MIDMLRPTIGISCDYDKEKQNSNIHRGYYEAVVEAGGLPILIPNIAVNHTRAILAVLDGIIFTGGPDVEPAYFKEPAIPGLGYINPIRDELEISLCRQAMEEDIPILAICRGIQLLNIAMGGTIYQDLASQWSQDFLLKHSQSAPDWYGSHQVNLLKGSKLAKMLGASRLWVNSFHHQAIKDLAPGFKITARSDDGVVEGIESTSHNFAVGIQWHPEKMWERDGRMLGLFKGLVSAATKN